MGWRKGHVHTTHQVSQDYPKQDMVGCVRTTGNRRGGILHRTLLIATHDVIDSPQEPPNQCLPSSGLDFLWHGSIRSAVLRSPSLSRDANRRDYLVVRTNWISDRNGIYLFKKRNKTLPSPCESKILGKPVILWKKNSNVQFAWLWSSSRRSILHSPTLYYARI